MEMFFPLLVGLYESLFSFMVLELYKCTQKLEIKNFWETSLV